MNKCKYSDNNVNKFWSRIIIPEDLTNCWIYSGTETNSGHGMFWAGKNILAHRFSWEFYNGEIPKGKLVLHDCDIPNCINPSHLYLGTHQDNMDDMVNRDRSCYGSLSGKSILTENIVIDMITRIYNDEFKDVNHIAEIFNISPENIRDILNGRTWNHILVNLVVPLTEIKNKVIGNQRSGPSTLTPSNIEHIRELISNGVPVLEIANMFDVSKVTIYNIKNNKYYKKILNRMMI